MEDNKNSFVIITGMSGAGKSQAANAFEDMGYFCIDNIPPLLISSVIDLNTRSGSNLTKIAVTADLRGGEMFNDIETAIEDLKKRNITPYVLYLDASDTELVRRYTENRRIHPFTSKLNLPLSEAIAMERNLLMKMHSSANYIIDTTHTSSKQLKNRITDIFSNGSKSQTLISCMSFGFKYGAPSDADLVFDARCLPNPFYIDELRPHTGKDKEIEDYLLKYEQVKMFIDKICDFIEFSLPYYQKEGKSQLVIAVGCTGGKHRSVYCAQQVFKHFLNAGYNAGINHRDIDK